jgi:hypothetical protein
MSKILKATHTGEIHIGNIDLPCYVLEDGTRVLSQRGVNKALERPEGGAGKLPSFIGLKALNPFISNDFIVRVSEPIIFIPPRGGNTANGIPASVLPEICEIWLNAREAGALSDKQLRTAKQAEILIRGLAHVGIIALVDEATGYQEIRDKRALEKILDAYLQKELAAWAKRFPDEFYKELFRLRGWKWNPMTVSRPSVVGRYTNDLIYERLAPNILEELEKRNPKDDKGNRKGRHHQLLTDDVGHPALAQHLHAVIGLMRGSANWDGFYRFLQRAYPKKNEQLPLLLED